MKLMRFIFFTLILISCQRIPTEEIKTIETSITQSIDISTITTPVDSQTINGVTISIDWFSADAKRVSFGYTITGLPNVPEAIDLFGNITLLEKSGTGELGWGGDTSISRVDESSGILKGTWSSVFLTAFQQTLTSFDLFITLGHDSVDYDTNYIIASFPLPVNATAFPPNVFPPKLPEKQIGNFYFEIEVQVDPAIVLTPHQIVTTNGIAMILEKVEITPSFTTTTLCYPKPSNADWMVGRSSITNFERTEMNNTYSLIFDTEFGGYTSKSPVPTDFPSIENGRCIQMEFLTGHANQSSSITLIIPTLVQSMPEAIPEDELAIAREKLLEEGIDMEWQVFSGNGGGGAGPVYNKLPVGMSEE